MSHDSLVTKPASGHWTDAYPELGRGPVSLEDCVSEEFYEKEREHVFKKTWLYMGRVERVPKSGSYFTRELRFLNTSIIIVRGKDDVIRAFHNICPHRGNKMLWEDDPFQEVAGRAPLLYCRFHGWRYKLDGSLHSATRKDLLLDFDADSCRVPAIQCEVWEGFIFINLNPHNTESVRSFLGELAHGIEGYPFEGPHQVYQVQGRVAVQLEDFRRRLRGELPRAVPARILLRRPHRGGQRGVRSSRTRSPTRLAYQLKGPHRMFSFSGEPSQKTPYSKPIECVMEASAAGPWNKRVDRGPMPAGTEPDTVGEVRLRLVPVLPELRADLRCVRLHASIPTGPPARTRTSSKPRCTTSRPTTHKERLGQELTVTFLNDIILEDASPSEGLQAMLNSGALTHFTMNDEEILLRHLHKSVADYVEAGEKAKASHR